MLFMTIFHISLWEFVDHIIYKDQSSSFIYRQVAKQQWQTLTNSFISQSGSAMAILPSASVLPTRTLTPALEVIISSAT